MKQKIVVIVGPTAVGKTAFSIEVAKKINGEIISGDSMQVYKDLDIGTAKVSREEKENIPHHLIDFKEIEENYTVSDFQKDAEDIISEIAAEGRIPIIVGGTGLYIESLIYPVSYGSEAKPNYALRKELEKLAGEQGNKALWERLEDVDPKAANKIHPNNVQRVVRALEVYEETGTPFSAFQNEKKKKDAKYDAIILALNTDRDLLYQRINQRVDLMIENGLVDEAHMLWEKLGPEPEAQSTKAIGYKELFDYFNQEVSLEKAIEAIKQNSRRYAKRQLTWFRNRLENVHWVDFVTRPEDKTASIEKIKEFLEGE